MEAAALSLYDTRHRSIPLPRPHPQAGGLPKMILLYHKVALEAATEWWVSADAFDRQMAALSAYEVVHLADYDFANPRHVVITFDGVYENVYDYAFPLLRKWGYPFELFVTGDYIGGDNAFDAIEPLAR